MATFTFTNLLAVQSIQYLEDMVPMQGAEEDVKSDKGKDSGAYPACDTSLVVYETQVEALRVVPFCRSQVSW